MQRKSQATVAVRGETAVYEFYWTIYPGLTPSNKKHVLSYQHANTYLCIDYSTFDSVHVGALKCCYMSAFALSIDFGSLLQFWDGFCVFNWKTHGDNHNIIVLIFWLRSSTQTKECNEFNLSVALWDIVAANGPIWMRFLWKMHSQSSYTVWERFVLGILILYLTWRSKLINF